MEWLGPEVSGRQDGADATLTIGLFSEPLRVNYFFGIPRSASYFGKTADVKRVILAATAHNGSAPVDFMRSSGMLGSNFEAMVFDTIYKRSPGSGGSAVRYLAKAVASGAPIYRITAANAQMVDSLNLSEEVKADITNAVAIGKEAVVSDTPFASGRWTGVGYVITDPQTGAGAYLIEGGLDGGADNAGCAEVPAVEPASEPVNISKMSFTAVLALAIIAILVAATAPAVAVQVAVVGLVFIVASSPVQAAPPPLEPGLQALWDVTFGRALGPFPTGPFPGEGLEGYGICDKATFKALRAEQNTACRQKGSCENGECDSEKIKQMIANQTACIDARINMMMTCFNGGDETHWGEVRNRLVPIEHCQKCLSDTMAGQCTE